MPKKWFVFLFTMILCTLSLTACKQGETMTDTSTEESEMSTEESETEDEIPTSIMVWEREFSVDEINAGIKNLINNVLYYYGDHEDSDYMMYNKNLVLNQKIEYDLFYIPNTGDGENDKIWGGEILFVMPGIEHPLSQPDDVQIYGMSTRITEEGISSAYLAANRISTDRYKSLFDNEEYIYLGRHSLYMEEIVPPVYEEKSEEWKRNVETGIQLYMDQNEIYGGESFKPGKYKVYVMNFTKADCDSWILFEHEDGDIYYGIYYYVNIDWPNSPANLNHVELKDEDRVEYSKSYYEKLKEHAAICVEYEVKEK